MQLRTAREKFPPRARRGKILKRMQLQNYVQALPACWTNSVLSRALGNTAHRSTPLEAFSFKLYENCPVKFLDTVRSPLKEAHTNVKLHVKLHGTAWKGGRTALSVRKFGGITVERSVWTKPRCWTVPCERSDRSNFSAGGKFVLCRVSLASV